MRGGGFLDKIYMIKKTIYPVYPVNPVKISFKSFANSIKKYIISGNPDKRDELFR